MHKTLAKFYPVEKIVTFFVQKSQKLSILVTNSIKHQLDNFSQKFSKSAKISKNCYFEGPRSQLHNCQILFKVVNAA